VLSGFFACTTAALVAVGLFGLVSLHAHQRTAEIGARLVLGRSRRLRVLAPVLASTDPVTQ
jgi:hypothetical protein